MEKKTLYVVTQTIVSRDTLSVDTYPIGHTENLYVAKRIIEDEFNKLMDLDYKNSSFEFNKRGFSFKTDYVISIVELLISKEL